MPRRLIVTDPPPAAQLTAAERARRLDRYRANLAGALATEERWYKRLARAFRAQENARKQIGRLRREIAKLEQQ